ncbi:MAG: hypothetical protein JWO96_716 [Candidatus Saccharibacteria bacterium]|nr:hypothetical protein [Candidatus Saccharibacteria bacterium]
MSKQEISIAEAKQDKLQYVVANFVVVNPAERTVLLLQRSNEEKVHPGKWAFPGGKLEHDNIAKMIEEEEVDPLEGVEDVLGKLAMRETLEESGLTVISRDDVILKNKVFIRPDKVPVFMVSLMAEYQGGEVILEKGFIDSAWSTEQQLDSYDCIRGVREEARKALNLL